MLEVLRRFREHFSNKTLLEQFLIVLSLVLLVSFVSLLLVLTTRNGSTEIEQEEESTVCTTEICLKHGDTEDKSAVCLTDTCLKYATNILQNINPSVDACDDFYEFACGSYNKHHTLPDRKRAHNVEDDVEDEVYAILRNLLTSKNFVKSRSFKDAKVYYKCCIEGTNEFEGISDTIQLILKTSDVRWSFLPSDKEWNKAVMKMILYGSYPFYDISLKRKAGSEVIEINLSKPEAGTKQTLLTEAVYKYSTGEHWRMQKDYRDLIENTLLMVEKGLNNQKKLDEENCTRLRDMAKGYVNWERKVATDKRFACYHHSPKFQSPEWVLALLQELDLNDESPRRLSVSYNCTNYVRVIEDQLKFNENRYYALWRHIARFLPIVSSSFRHSYMRLCEAMNPVDKDGAAYNEIKYYNENWKQCVYLTNEAYGLAIAHAFKSEDYEEEDEEISSLAESLLRNFEMALTSQTAINNETKENYLRKLTNLVVDVNYPDIISDDVKVDDFYFEDNSKYYKESCNPVKQIQHPKSYVIYEILRNECIKTKHRLLNMGYESLNESSFFNIPPLSTRVNADFGRNILTLPAGVLRFPYYTPNFFKFAKHGGISSVIIRELLRKLRSENGRDLRIVSSSEKDCLIENSSEKKSHSTWEDVILDHIALKVAYQLYQMDIDEEPDEPNLPNLDYSSDQLFFIQYAQMFCEIRNNTFSVFDNSISAKFRVNNVMMNKKEFADAFQCPEESPMNPEMKCSVWE